MALLLNGVRRSLLSAAAISVFTGGEVLTGAGGVIKVEVVVEAAKLHDEE